MKKEALSLYLIADSCGRKNVDLLHVVQEAVRGGVTAVQLREKSASDLQRKELALALLPFLRARNIPFLLNDHIALAKEIAADGVHLGQSDPPPSRARALLGPKAVIGLTIESCESYDSLDQAEISDLGSVDYLAASPVFSTDSKLIATKPFGLVGLQKLRERSYLPLIAIGGIHSGNIESVAQTGVQGVAVLSAICFSHSPYQSAIALKKTLQISSPEAKKLPRVLSIAGSDSGGGAGIQADLKTFQCLGCFGMSAITAVTAQNTLSVQEVFPLSPSLVSSQIDAVIDDIGLDAVKVGMVFSREILRQVVRSLKRLHHVPIVLDPVAAAKSGSPLLLPDAVALLKKELFPLATLCTPNLPEAELLTGKRISSREEMETAANELLKNTPAVFLKGGHSQDAGIVSDLFMSRHEGSFWLTYPRVQTQNTHGTGCTLSSAIAAYLAKGFSVIHAVKAARNYLQGAILENAVLAYGTGHGSVGHSWRWK